MNNIFDSTAAWQLIISGADLLIAAAVLFGAPTLQ